MGSGWVLLNVWEFDPTALPSKEAQELSSVVGIGIGLR